MHVRQQIRHQIKEVLRGCPTAQGRVFGLERLKVGESDTPHLMVVVDGEAIEGASIARNRLLERQLTFTVYCVSDSGRHECEDELDQMSSEVEKALYDSGHLGGLVKHLTPSVMNISADPTIGTGVLSLQYTCTYYTNISNPELAR